MDQFDQLFDQLQKCCPGMELLKQEPMARHTTFRIGGPVPLMARPTNEEQVLACVRLARENQIPLVVLGNGSNLLVADEGVQAFVLDMTGLSRLERTGEREITVGAGVTLARLASFAAGEGLTGLEFAGGIPGTLGGAVMMNAGAYGGEMVQVVRRTRCLTPEGTVKEIVGEEHEFSYRHSVFSQGEDVILSSVLELEPGQEENIRAQMAELAQKRKSKQPLEYPSAGSMFKRPQGYFAAALIDQCGLKGFTVGGAQVSEKHAGCIINRGGATCADVLALVREVQRRVREQTGVELEMEVRRMG